MEALFSRIGAALSAPVNRDLDLGKALLYFALFVVVAWVVVDTLNILKKGLVE